MIVDNRMSDLLYYKDTFKGEKTVQRLFILLADAYCRISDIDLSPEDDYGMGPVDFKLSSGYSRKVLLEVKLAKSSQLMHGLEVQLPAYLKAESTAKGIYIVVMTEQNDDQIVNNFWNKVAANNLSETLRDNIIVIDARKRKSASNL